MPFAGELAEHGIVQAIDIKTDRAETRDAKFANFARTSIAPARSGAKAPDGADAALSLVTADQALAPAQGSARKQAIFEGNSRRVFPRLDAMLKASGR